MFQSCCRCLLMPRSITLLLLPQQCPSTEHISKLIGSKTSQINTTSLILHHHPILRCTFLVAPHIYVPRPLSFPWKVGWLPAPKDSQSAAGERRAAKRAVPAPQMTSYTAVSMVGKVINGKLHPHSGTQPGRKHADMKRDRSRCLPGPINLTSLSGGLQTNSNT